MNGRRAAPAEGAEVVGFEHVQHLHQQRSAGRRRRHGDDLEPPVGAAHGFPPHGPVRVEIPGIDQPAPGGHLRHDEFRRGARVEPGASVFRYPFEGCRQIRLTEHVLRLVRAAVWTAELGKARGVGREPVAVIRELPGEVRRQREAFLAPARWRGR